MCWCAACNVCSPILYITKQVFSWGTNSAVCKVTTSCSSSSHKSKSHKCCNTMHLHLSSWGTKPRTVLMVCKLITILSPSKSHLQNMQMLHYDATLFLGHAPSWCCLGNAATGYACWLLAKVATSPSLMPSRPYPSCMHMFR